MSSPHTHFSFGPVGDSEEDIYVEIKGYDLHCLATFENGHLQTLRHYRNNFKNDQVLYPNDKIRYLSPGEIEDIEYTHQENWRDNHG